MDWSDDSQIAGQTVGDFRIEKPLGACLWRAIRLSDRQNAWFWRLERAHMPDLPIEGCQGPGVLPIWDSGHLDDDHGYLITPAPRGPNLDDLLEESPLPPARALGIVLNIANAMVTFHDEGQILGNLSTRDIHLASDWRSDTTVRIPPHPVLLGAACCRTIAGYAGPEHSPASGYPFDHRADQFSLGVIAFELLTGTTPHNPDAPPGERTLLPALPHPRVPDILEPVLERMLDPRPSRRYATDQELLTALREVEHQLAPSISIGQFTPVMSRNRTRLPPGPPPELPSLPPEETYENNLAFLTLLVIVLITALSISTLAVITLS